MRICLISNLYAPYILGGTEVYLGALIKHLSTEHQISLITTIPFDGRDSLTPKLEEISNVRIYSYYPLNVYHQYRRPKSAFLKTIWYLLDVYNIHTRRVVQQVLREEKPDLVHTHNLRGLSVSVWDAVKDAGLPLIHTLHDYHLLCRNSLLLHGKDARLCDGNDIECRLYRPLMRGLTGSKPDAVLAPSQFVLDQFKQAGFFQGARQAVLPLWADVPGDLEPGTSLGGSLRVLYMGTVSRHKGVRYLISAFLQLEDANAQLEIIGSGDQELDECRRLAQDDKRIRFLGFVSGEEKERAFARASVVVLPSAWYDNSPVVIYESLARGKPVVASRIGGIPELVQHEYNGLLFEPRNTDDLAESLERLNRDCNLLAFLSRNAKASSTRFTAEAHVQGLLQIYRSVTNSV